VATHMNNVWRPERTREIGDFVVNPRRIARENGAWASGPVSQVSRGGIPDTRSCGEVEIGIAVFGDGTRIVRIGEASDVNRKAVQRRGHKAQAGQELFKHSDTFD